MLAVLPQHRLRPLSPLVRHLMGKGEDGRLQRVLVSLPTNWGTTKDNGLLEMLGIGGAARCVLSDVRATIIPQVKPMVLVRVQLYVQVQGLNPQYTKNRGSSRYS